MEEDMREVVEGLVGVMLNGLGCSDEDWFGDVVCGGVKNEVCVKKGVGMSGMGIVLEVVVEVSE